MLGLVLVLLGISLANHHSFFAIVIKVGNYKKKEKKKKENNSYEYTQKTLCHTTPPHPLSPK